MNTLDAVKLKENTQYCISDSRKLQNTVFIGKATLNPKVSSKYKEIVPKNLKIRQNFGPVYFFTIIDCRPGKKMVYRGVRIDVVRYRLLLDFLVMSCLFQ